MNCGELVGLANYWRIVTPTSGMISVETEQSALPQAISVQDDSFVPMLRIFYDRLFPVKDFYKWLSYGNVQKNYFCNREFSFTLASDAYIRFQSFANADELKQELLKMTPVKIDLGAVYNIKPKDKKMFKAGAFQPLERELVFDIDMTDYDEIRTCCKGGDICLKCWDFMTVSIKVIDRVLRQDFGFKHLLWIYSGRRGVHCWIGDEKARLLNAQGRKAIVSYIEVVKGGESQSRKVNLSTGSLHPSLLKAYQVVEEYFPKVVENQDILSTSEWDKVLQLVPDEETRNSLIEYFLKNPDLDSTEKWSVLDAWVTKAAKKSKNSFMNSALRDIKFQYCYPRLDDHVSTGVNHLLKAPFCVHPKTGRVCVPIDPAKCHEFNPFTVPTLEQLITELENSSESSSLNPYLIMFKEFIGGLEAETREKLRQMRMEQDQKLMF